jgi:hypothetical protein
MGARQLEAAIKVARSSSQHSNISGLAAAAFNNSSQQQATEVVFQMPNRESQHSRRQRRPSVFAKAVTDEANLANKSLVDEKTPLVRRKEGGGDKNNWAAGGRQGLGGGKKGSGSSRESVAGGLRPGSDGKPSSKNLIEEEKVETKAVGYKEREISNAVHIQSWRNFPNHFS